jgi:hypothetical protein
MALNLLNVLPAILFFQETDGSLNGVLVDGTQLGDHPCDLGCLEVKVRLRLSWLASFYEAADVLNDMVNKSGDKSSILVNICGVGSLDKDR